MRLARSISITTICVGLLLAIARTGHAQTFTATGSLQTARQMHTATPTATLLGSGAVLVVGGYNGAYLNSAEIYNPSAGSFASTGSLNTARELQTATLLANGLVLVAGGYGTSGYLASAELYDPGTGSFVPTGSMNTAREYHTATLLNDGTVLISGGYNGSGYVASAEVYNPVSGTFTVTGNLNTARAYQTATMLPTGMVLVAGGYGSAGYLSSAELYNPTTGTFTTTGSLSTAREYQTATLLGNGEVLIAGGKGTAGYLSSAELYNPSTGSFSTTGSLNTARQGHGAAVLSNGLVLIDGGQGTAGYLSSAELYNPATATFTLTGSLNTARSLHTTTLLNDGRIIVAGGTNGGYLSSAELYNPSAQTFTLTGSLNVSRNGQTATPLPNGMVLLVSGDSNGNTAELYNPLTGTFTTTGNPITARSSFSFTATLLNSGLVLVVGGDNDIGTVSAAELYNPTTGTFTATGSLNTARAFHTATLLSNGMVLIAGGIGNGSYLSSAELYNPATGTFVLTGSMTTARELHTATLLSNGLVLIAAGYNYTNQANTLSSAELYNASTGTFSATGSLNAGRYYYTATLLTNGTVLVAGGTGASGNQMSSAELYSPSAGTFAYTGSMTAAREYQTATLLANGVVLVAGGYNNTAGNLSSAELYNPATGTFTATANLNTARFGHTATLLSNEMVLLAGGQGSSSSGTTAELYQLVSVTPILGALSPTVGPAGTAVTISGANFGSTQGTSSVMFNGTLATPSSWTASSIVAPVPAGATSGDVIVTVGGVASNAIPFGVSSVSTHPLITNLSPVSGPIGTSVTINGLNFGSTQGASTVSLNGLPATPTSWNASTIVITIPNGATSGYVQVSVGGFASQGVGFAVTGAPPSISAISASSGIVGDCLTISGVNFGATQGTSTVKFNGTSATATSWSASSIHVCVPSGATTGPLNVNVGGVASNSIAFKVLSGSAAALTSSLNPARYSHTATLLANGMVLIAGGCAQGASVYASAELYNPVTGTFSATGSLNTARCLHTATLLQNGTVLIAGGYGAGGSGVISSAEIYNPSTGTFTTTGSMTTPRAYDTATLLQNGMVLIAGGNSNGGTGYLSSAELYNPVTGTFAPAGSMTTAREYHTATLLQNGMVLMAGGSNGTSALSSAELYNPSSGAFVLTGSMTAARWYQTATLLQDGTVLVEAGDNTSGFLNSAELYSLSTGSFAATGSLSTGRIDHTATRLNNGMVLTSGGYGPGSVYLTSEELYDPSTKTFATTGSLNTARAFHSATTLNNGTVLIAGGEGSGSVALSSGELYQVNYGTPFITTLSQLSGAVGSSLTISGQNFGATQGTSTLTFNGTTATPTSWSAGSIVAPVPVGATSGNIIVTVNSVGSNGVNFIVSATPNITSLSPTSGSISTSVTISGTNFGTTQGSSAVTFNGTVATPTSWTPATTFVQKKDTYFANSSGATSESIAFPSNVGAGHLLLCVVGWATASGASITSLTDSIGNTYTSLPLITNSPGESQAFYAFSKSGAADTVTAHFSGSGGTYVGIACGEWSGPTYLDDHAEMSGSSTVPISYVTPSSSGELMIAYGADYYSNTWSSSGSWTLRSSATTVPYGLEDQLNSGANSAAAGFLINSSEPWTAGIVAFAGSPTTVVVPVPNGATTGNVVVTVGGLSSNGASFTVTGAPPVVSSVSPVTGVIGTSVTIAGANFGSTQGTSTVAFNGTSATPTTWAAGSIVVPVPAAATSGPIVVAVGGVASNGVTFTVTPSPNITSLSPTSGAVGSPVTITGTNFGPTNGTSTVTLNGMPATPTSWTATGIVVPVPAGATTGNFVVTVAGIASNGVSFTVSGTPPIITGYRPGTFSSMGNLNTGRDYHTMTLLNDGAVLVAGGYGNAPDALSSAEIYNPVTGEFSFTGSLNSGRNMHTATLLQNGLVLVAGGENNSGYVSGAELYNPFTNAFVLTGNLVTARSNHTATLLNNGMVLITGGYYGTGNVTASAELYNPATGTFTATGNMTAARAYHTATLLNNGTVLITGGYGTTTTLSSAELYNPSTGTFTATTGNMTTARNSHTATLLSGGTVLVVGGNDANGNTLSSAELFNPSAGTFAATGSMIAARYQFAANLLSDGMVLVAGGWNSTGNLSSAELYNVSSATFTATGSMSVPGHDVAVEFSNGTVLLAGGYGATTWNTASDLYSPAAASVGTSITILGANFGSSQGSSTVTFNGTTGTPTTWSATSIAVPVPSGATTGNLVVTVGGVASNPVVFTVLASPTISSLSPTSGPVDALVTISGTNFGSAQGASSVTFSGTSATVVGWSATAIEALVPPGASTGNVVVTVGGASSNGVSFTVVAAAAIPGISSVEPATGVVGTSVEVNGANFGATKGTSTVMFNGTAATPLTWSTSSIVVPVPSGATTGNVVVTVGGVPSDGVPFTVVPIPNIISLSPTSGSVGSPVTINGTNFGLTQATGTVTFNGTVATPTSWSSTQIIAQVPNGATTGNVVVTVDHEASNGTSFTVAAAPSITDVTGGFAVAGSLNAARDYHTMTLLSSGSVLVAGGFGPPATGGSPLSSAEVYSPTTGTFTFTGSLNTARYWHTATLLQSGQVLVAGGADPNGNDLASAELYNPVTGTFTTTGTMTAQHYAAAAAALSDGAVLITGGHNNGTDTSIAEIYNPATGSFSATGSMTVARDSHTATLLQNGMVLITGGTNSSNSALSSAELYNPATGTFTATAGNMTTARTLHSATLLGNGMVLIAGGFGSSGSVLSSAELYNPSTNTFSATGGMITARDRQAATLLTDGAVLVAGGFGTSGSLSSGELYSVSSAIFTATGSMATAGHDAAIKLKNGLVLLSGGYSSTWNSASDFHSPAAAAIGTSVTIIGMNFGSTKGSSTVTFNGTTATPTTWSNTSIVVPVPSGATSGPLVVTVSGVASNSVLFNVLGASPSITSLSVNSGSVGTAVTITGTNFGAARGAGGVYFNGIPVTSVSSWSSTSIGVHVPNGATTGNVVVVVDGFASNGVAFTVAAAPSITSMLPAVGVVGTSVTITGVNFGSTQGSSTVTFNGTSATPTTWGATSIVVPVPMGATSGNVVVTVGGVASNPEMFAVLTLPYIAGISPSLGPIGTSVTISGGNFGSTQGSSVVTFNGVPAPLVTSWTGTSIVVPVPIGATTGNVVVVAPGVGSNAASFTVSNPGPSIASIYPPSAVWGTSVTISGSNFGSTEGTGRVFFNGVQSTPTSWSPTVVTVPVPRGSASGPVTVTVGAAASNGVSFTVRNWPRPVPIGPGPPIRIEPAPSPVGAGGGGVYGTNTTLSTNDLTYSISSGYFDYPYYPVYDFGFDLFDPLFQTEMDNAWNGSQFYDVGVYIGGRNYSGPSIGVLTSNNWVSHVQNTGWGIFPIFVGLQPPCVNQNPIVKVIFPTGGGTSAGTQDGATAVANANVLGFQNSIIYANIEQYNSNPSCAKDVMDYINAWVSTVQGGGLAAGVYLSKSDLTDFFVPTSSGFYSINPLITNFPDAIYVTGLVPGPEYASIWSLGPTDQGTLYTSARIHQFLKDQPTSPNSWSPTSEPSFPKTVTAIDWDYEYAPVVPWGSSQRAIEAPHLEQPGGGVSVSQNGALDFTWSSVGDAMSSDMSVGTQPSTSPNYEFCVFPNTDIPPISDLDVCPDDSVIDDIETSNAVSVSSCDCVSGQTYFWTVRPLGAYKPGAWADALDFTVSSSTGGLQ